LKNIKLKYNIHQIDKAIEFIFNNLTSKVVLFYGEMGSGKTTIIKRLLYKLDCHDVISSPTFSIVNEYKLTDSNAYHFDFYRIKNHYEALDIGIDDYFCSGYWNFIEWPEKITNLLPEEVMVVNLEIISTTERSIECFESEVL